MRNEPEARPHTQWARQDPPPKGTWIAYARRLQHRPKILDIDTLQQGGNAPSKAERQKLLEQYAQQIVQPAVQGKGSTPQTPAALPWAWIHTCIRGQRKPRHLKNGGCGGYLEHRQCKGSVDVDYAKPVCNVTSNTSPTVANLQHPSHETRTWTSGTCWKFHASLQVTHMMLELWDKSDR